MTSNLVKRPVLGGVWCSPPLAQCALNAVAPHRGLGYLEREPHAHVLFQADAVHVVVDGLFRPAPSASWSTPVGSMKATSFLAKAPGGSGARKLPFSNLECSIEKTLTELVKF